MTTWIIGLASPAVAILTILGSAWAGRHAGHAALKQAEGTVKDAATNERKAASADWAAYTAELRQENVDLRKHNQEQAERLDKLEHRVDDSELRAAAAELRALKSQELYSLALVYLRRVFVWANDHWPGVEIPPPPPELEADL